jgi:hypothetical protein
MSNKRQVQESLQSYFSENGISDVRVPDTRAGWLQRIEWDSGRFPNLVAKLTDSERGVGVRFFKARNLQQANELAGPRAQAESSRIGGMLGEAIRRSKSGDALLQPFVRSHLFDRDRLVNYRVNVLVTPVGNELLSVVKLVGLEPVPTKLAYGVVRNPVPYLVNGGGGAQICLVDASEIAALVPVARTLGKAMSSILDARFQTARTTNAHTTV